VTAAFAGAADDANDVLKGLVQPYVPQGERARFLKAAGKNNELSKDEFLASAKAEDGFARPFDTWEALTAWDKDRNRQIGWFEADAYRRDLRRKILAAWDGDRDGKLTESEYATANAKLAGGTLPWQKKADAKANGRNDQANDSEKDGGRKSILPPMPPEKTLLAKYDADGDGKLSPGERRTAYRTENGLRYKALLDAYDADANGVLTRKERGKAWRDFRRNRRRRERKWELLLFDDNGDGEFSDEEKAVRKKYRHKMRDMGKQIMTKVMDSDGDGEISKMERLSVIKNAQFIAAANRVKKRFRGEMDMDGDGKADMVEKMDFDRRARGAMEKYVQKMITPYDTDDDGRFNSDERKLIWAEIEDRFAGYMTRADADRDGQLTVVEAEWLVTTFMEDVGVLTPPPAGKDDRGDAR
jgi:Ca2+-binding EF-hand superfamily protein